jgi:glucose dehydrogenase
MVWLGRSNFQLGAMLPAARVQVPKAGKEDIVQTFDPVRHYGASQSRFLTYISLCLANKLRTMHSKHVKDALGRKLAQFILAAMVCTAITRPVAQSSRDVSGSGDDWPYYGHDAGGMRYSPLAQINRRNVATLKVAWTVHLGDISDGSGGKKRSGLETTPILVDGTLYLTTGFNRVFALDPETGAQRWVYDPMIDIAGNYGDGLINRGVAAWLDPARAKGDPCGRRIFETTLDARLIALDGLTGEPCRDFGNRGQVSFAMSRATFPRNIT